MAVEKAIGSSSLRDTKSKLGFSFAFFIFLRVFEPSWLKFLCKE